MGLLVAAGCQTTTLAPATHLEVVREADDQRSTVLDVDLTSGRGVLRTPDGSAHPLQLEPHRVDAIRQALRDSAWANHRARSPEAGRAVTLFVVRAQLRSQDQSDTLEARWHEPSDIDLPPQLPMLADLFAWAYRQIHPLSDTVDLIE